MGVLNFLSTLTGGKVGEQVIADLSLLPVRATGSTTARTSADIAADVIKVQSFGVKADGVTDDTASLQAALTWAPAGSTVLLAPTPMLISGGLVITKPITLMGHGFASGSGSVLLVSAAVASTVDIITAIPPNGVSYEYLTLQDFGILPQSGTPGRDGIRFEVSAAGSAWSKVNVSRVYIRAKAGRAVNVNNPNLDHDAFFASRFEDNVFQGGIYLNGAGDSILVDHNTINTASGATSAGKGPGVEVRLLSAADPAGLGDASQLVIRDNNIVSVGGAIWVRAGVRTKILHNNIEGVTTEPMGSGTNKALIDLDGDATHVLMNCLVADNYVGLNHAANMGIRVNYSRSSVVRDNEIPAGGGWWNNYPTTPATYDATWYGVQVTGNAQYTKLGENTWTYPTYNGNETRLASVSSTTSVWQPTNAITLSPSPNIVFNLIDAGYLTVNVTGAGAFVIADPVTANITLYPLFVGRELVLKVKNTSGGAMGAITWGGSYKMSAWTNPANAFSRSVTLRFDGTYWVEVSRTPADVPN